MDIDATVISSSRRDARHRCNKTKRCTLMVGHIVGGGMVAAVEVREVV